MTCTGLGDVFTATAGATVVPGTPALGEVQRIDGLTRAEKKSGTGFFQGKELIYFTI